MVVRWEQKLRCRRGAIGCLEAFLESHKWFINKLSMNRRVESLACWYYCVIAMVVPFFIHHVHHSFVRLESIDSLSIFLRPKL
jgi:hypothetical protein